MIKIFITIIVYLSKSVIKGLVVPKKIEEILPKILKDLFKELAIDKKVEKFEDLFDFKAVNLSGVSLSDENLGEIKKGRYLQILAISYDKNASQKSKNISLAYFGRVEHVESSLKNKVVEFSSVTGLKKVL